MPPAVGNAPRRRGNDGDQGRGNNQGAYRDGSRRSGYSQGNTTRQNRRSQPAKTSQNNASSASSRSSRASSYRQQYQQRYQSRQQRSSAYSGNRGKFGSDRSGGKQGRNK